MKDCTTDWVMFTVDGLADLASQMTNVAVQARSF